MRLYHFTCNHAIEGCRRRGLTLGMLTFPDHHSPSGFRMVPDHQWLTLRPDWTQPWATQNSLKCDRTEWRLSVDIPEGATSSILTWGQIRLMPGMSWEWTVALESVGGCDDWRVYAGRIPVAWITAADRKPELTLGALTMEKAKAPA